MLYTTVYVLPLSTEEEEHVIHTFYYDHVIQTSHCQVIHTSHYH